jgi:DegV family protein with EDD domain
MNDQRIAVLTDSGTDVPGDFCAAHDVRIIPLHINFPDGSSFRSGVDISSKELLDRMQTEIPKTSLPAPDQIRQAFKAAQDEGYQKAVMVTLSSGLSATYQTAQLVSSQMKGFPTLIADTRSIGIAAGLIVMETVSLIESGTPFEKLKECIEKLAQRTRVFFSVKDFEYLHRGGRISEPIYRLGKILNIKPVLTCEPTDGHYIMAKKARGWERALDTEVRLVAEHAKAYKCVRLAICCSDADPLFDRLENKLRHEIGEPNIMSILHSGISADLLVHTGPDLVGIGVMGY